MRCNKKHIRYSTDLPCKVSSSLVADKALSTDRLSAYVTKPILNK